MPEEDLRYNGEVGPKEMTMLDRTWTRVGLLSCKILLEQLQCLQNSWGRVLSASPMDYAGLDG